MTLAEICSVAAQYPTLFKFAAGIAITIVFMLLLIAVVKPITVTVVTVDGTALHQAAAEKSLPKDSK